MTSTEIKESLKKLVTPYEVLQQIDQLFLEVATLRTRLQEAEWIIEKVYEFPIGSDGFLEWMTRRDAWLSKK